MTPAELAERLGGRASGSNWVAPCPAHDDSNPSLSLSEGDGGMVLVKCHSGCTQESVIAALRDQGLWQSENRSISLAEIAAAKQLPVELLHLAGWKDVSYDGKPAVEIPYLNRQRRVVATQLRIGMKGDRFRWRKGSKSKQLYGLEQWRPNELTLLVEGSTDCLTARLHKQNCLGLSGATGWDEEFAPHFKHCDAILAVIEDDDGGQKLYADLAKSCLRDKFRILSLPEGIKDLNALHCADPARFSERLQAAMQNAEPIESRVVMVTAATVEVKPLEWLVPGVVPLGKVTLIAGDPGLGKSLLTADLAAVVSSGRARHPWSSVKAGEAILLSAEDDAADTIVPRLSAAGAVLSNVHLLLAVRKYDEQSGASGQRYFSLVEDALALGDALRLRDGKVKVIFVDPISAYLGSVDSHVNAQVRAALAPLADIAAIHGVAIVIVSHLNKGNSVGSSSALYRVSGSLAFTAAARAVWAVAQDEADPERRLFLPLKNNLAKMIDGFAFRVVERDGMPVLQWEPGRVTVTAAEAFASTKEHRDAEVERWLTDRLASGHKFATSMWTEAESLRFSANRVKAAKKRLGVISTKEVREDGFAGWAWSLPGPPTRSLAQATGLLGPVGSLGRLEGDQGVQEDQEDRKEGKETSSSLSRIDEINRELEDEGHGL